MCAAYFWLSTMYNMYIRRLLIRVLLCLQNFARFYSFHFRCFIVNFNVRKTYAITVVSVLFLSLILLECVLLLDTSISIQVRHSTSVLGLFPPPKIPLKAARSCSQSNCRKSQNNPGHAQIEKLG